MAPTDLLKPVIERYLGGIIHFGRVGAKPGKPTTFASVPLPGAKRTNTDEQRWKPIFALPGNPASALVTFYVFVIPALRKMGGWPGGNYELPKVTVEVRRPQVQARLFDTDRSVISLLRYKTQCRLTLELNSIVL